MVIWYLLSSCLLEQQLLGTTSAFDKLADAQALDSARDYTDELSDSISGLIKAFENHEFGTEYFKTAFDALIDRKSTRLNSSHQD